MSSYVGTLAAGGTTCRPHNNPAKHVVRGGKVFCRDCGGYIGEKNAGYDEERNKRPKKKVREKYGDED